jgi:lipoyl(octanoyl) transferase
MIEWETTVGLMPLHSSVGIMEQRVHDIHLGKKNELIWLLEHPHVYTAGTSANKNHLLVKPTIPVELTRRGGSYTYHGPGQRIIYIMLDLAKQGKDIRKFVWSLEHWIIESLSEFNISAERREKRIGIWVVSRNSVTNLSSPDSELKIASIGLRVKNWISYFGISINVAPDLNYFNGIIPCGNKGFGVTSMQQQGLKTSLTELDYVLKRKFSQSFPAY